MIYNGLNFHGLIFFKFLLKLLTKYLLYQLLQCPNETNVYIFIVAFLENATIGYSLESLCVCVCVFLHDNSKRNRSRNTKLEYIVVYENSSDEFDIELHRIKVKVTVGIQKFSHLPQYKLSGPIVQLWYKLGTLY